jgi:hypothetical protein
LGGPVSRSFISTKGTKRPPISTLKASEYSTSNRTANYNLEEHKEFTKKVEKAKEQRDILSQIEQNPVLPRRERRKYDRPKYDTNIAE